MANRNERSLDDIKRESEVTRANLTDTVDELRSTVTKTVADLKHQFSPSVVKGEVVKYARTRGETLLRDAKDAARRNPMQAVAIGAGLAYPALRIVRTVPLPLMLIGAGYFFAGTQRGRDIAEGATDLMSTAIDDAKDAAGDIATDIKQSAAALGDRAMDTVQSVKDSVPTGLSGGKISDSITESLGNSASAVLDRTQGAAGSVSAQMNVASREASDAIGRYPLVVAGAGLLLGALVAAAIPRFKIEDELMGDASAELQARARKATGQGLDQINEKVGDIALAVADKVKGEGLDLDGLGEKLHDVGSRVRRVAVRGLNTAIESQDDNTNGSKGGAKAAKEGEYHG